VRLMLQWINGIEFEMERRERKEKKTMEMDEILCFAGFYWGRPWRLGIKAWWKVLRRILSGEELKS
jgi:hypothetical protein